MKKENNKFLILGYSLLAVIILFVFYLNFNGITYYCDSDLYGDMHLSKLMWEQKTLFPNNWVFGNQLYIISPPVISAFIYGIVGNIYTAMGITSCLCLFLFLASFYYMVKPFFKKTTIIYGLIALLILRITVNIMEDSIGQLFFLQASYYSFYTITAMLVFGIYVRFVAKSKVSILIVLLSIILSLAMGVQSIRQTAIMVIPIILLEIARIVYNIHKKYPLNKLKQTVIYTTLVSVFNFAGVLIGKIIPITREDIYVTDSIGIFNKIILGIKSLIYSFLDFLGFRGWIRDITKSNVSWHTPIEALLSITLLIIVLFGLWCVFKNLKRESNAKNYLLLLLALSVLTICGTFLLLNISRLTKYLFMLLILFAVLVMIAIENIKIKTKISKLVLIAMVVFFCVSPVLEYVPSIYESTFIESTEQKTAKYMLDNNYSVIYSDWEHAGAIAGASNGKIVAGRWDATKIFKIKSHTNVMDVYEAEDNVKACYLLTEDNIDDALEFVEGKGATVKSIKKFYNKDLNETWYLYTSDIQLMY